MRSAMSDDRNETLSHSVESARPDVEIQRDEDRLDDDFDIATAREQEHEEEKAHRHASDVPPEV
jgi:hypothetical protein